MEKPDNRRLPVTRLSEKDDALPSRETNRNPELIDVVRVSKQNLTVPRCYARHQYPPSLLEGSWQV
jgi:hypothetical protein